MAFSKKIQFEVVDWRNNDCSLVKTDADVILEKDNWNDYSYFTYYNLHLTGNISISKKTEYIGGIKILKKGQRTGDIYLVPKTFNTLPNDFCSYISNLDFYEKINRLLFPNERKILIESLNVYSFSEKIQQDFQDEEGVEVSFFRWGKMDSSSIAIARNYVYDDFVIPKSCLQDIKIKLNDSNEELTFKFKPDDDVDDYEDVPRSISVLIGRNGCGKSTILYRLSRLLMASVDRKSVV